MPAPSAATDWEALSLRLVEPNRGQRRLLRVLRCGLHDCDNEIDQQVHGARSSLVAGRFTSVNQVY